MLPPRLLFVGGRTGVSHAVVEGSGAKRGAWLLHDQGQSKDASGLGVSFFRNAKASGHVPSLLSLRPKAPGHLRPVRMLGSSHQAKLCKTWTSNQVPTWHLRPICVTHQSSFVKCQLPARHSGRNANDSHRKTMFLPWPQTHERNILPLLAWGGDGPGAPGALCSSCQQPSLLLRLLKMSRRFGVEPLTSF